MTKEKISLFLVLCFTVQADEMVHKFKSPSFSGIGTSSHYLTIENQEYTRKMTIKEEIKALQEQLKRDAENTTLARFIRNLESRIYAQISRQIVENMFGETQSTSGTFELEGNVISYSIEDGMITLTIIASDGSETIIQLPLGDFFLSSCALLFDPLENNLPPTKRIEPAQIGELLVPELANVRFKGNTKPIVAVYADSFLDQTGQRRSNSSYATFSSAVTQAPNAYLIRAVKHAGSNHIGFFEVVERVGLDNVTKERQIIRSTRQEFGEDNKLQPLLFAGLILQGGVISYESNVRSGGAGARYLGIGMSRQFKQDSVTVSLRTVSVSTGKVLLEVLVTKTILSASLDNDVFRFVNDSTELIEIENGLVRNESIDIALQTAVETAVLETIRQGELKGYWSTYDEE